MSRVPFYDDIEMPFGRFKGEVLRHIPDWYLKWALNNFEFLDHELSDAIKDTLEDRGNIIE
jgi:uncharacterized protein (DUF3820 family)